VARRAQHLQQLRVVTVSRVLDGPPVNRIARIVFSARGGGLHRTALADRLELPAHGKAFERALMAAYACKRIDFCGQYVVAPAKTTTTKGTSA
jgi:hypothetical protein